MIKSAAESLGRKSRKTKLHRALYLRLAQLIAYGAIVMLAAFPGSFTYRTNLLYGVFVVGLVLQLAGILVWKLAGRGTGWLSTRALVLHWYSSCVDLAVVLAIIYLTGTIESPFLLLITVPLLFVGNLLSLRTTLRAFAPAALTIVSFLGYLEMTGHIPHNNCYGFDSTVFQNAGYVSGSLLAVSAIVGLVLFLSNAFQRRLARSLDQLRRKEVESESKIVRLTRLYDISLGINSAMSTETLLKILAKEATLLLEQPWASIVLFNDKQEITQSVFVGVNQNAEARLPMKIRRGGLSEWIWTHGAPIVVRNTAKDKRANCSDFLAHFGIRSLVGFPLKSGKRVIGAFYAGDFKPCDIDEQKLQLLTSLSGQLSMAIEKSGLYESLQKKIGELSAQLVTLEKTNNLKSEFVAHVSHELRTPLTSIRAYVEALSDHYEDPMFEHRGEFLDIIQKETNRLIRIVNDILDVSKIEFGQRPLQRSSFEVRELVEDVVSIMSPTLREKDVGVDVEIPEGLPRVDADVDLIKQVFINLINNAVKYSPAGTRVTVSAEEEAVNLRLKVADQGIGIPKEELVNVFDKYFRANSESAMFDGVGLGLAIVKNIVEQHGGRISVESEEGVGSTFAFTVPREHCFNDLIGYIAEVVDAREQLQETLELIVRMIAEMLSAKIVSLMLLDRSCSELFVKVSYGLDEWVVENARVKVGEGIAGKVIESGVPLLIQNIEENEIYSCPNNPQYDTVSLLSVPLIVNDVAVGVINVNNKTSGQPFDGDDLNLLISFSERIARALERVRMVEDSSTFLADTIVAFRRIVENRSHAKAIERLVALTVKTSRKLGLSEKEVGVVQYVASVHDIGMTEVGDDILNKTLNLTSEEIRQIREHPQRGAELIRPLEFIESVSNIILYHHERVDGRGYPMGLKGEQIPVGSRILAVIDAFQAITEEKPYRSSQSTERAVTELVEHAGSQFDPDVVGAFISVLKEDGQLSTNQERDFQRALVAGAASSSRK